MVAKGGKKLIKDQAIKILKNKLLSKADLITPNIPEAEVLTNSKISTIEDVILAGNHLVELGAKNVLIKGGHLNHKNILRLFFFDELCFSYTERVFTNSYIMKSIL